MTSKSWIRLAGPDSDWRPASRPEPLQFKVPEAMVWVICFGGYALLLVGIIALAMVFRTEGLVPRVAIGGGLGALFAALTWRGRREAKRKQLRFHILAYKNKWSFGAADTQIPIRLRRFDPFNVGQGRIARFVVGSRPPGFEVFQYEYYTEVRTKNGRRRVYHHHSVATMRMGARSPGLSIKKEHFGHKFVDAFGGEDIDFEDGSFSRKFWVKSPSRRFAYDVLHPRTIELVKQMGPRWTWIWIDDQLVVFRAGKMTVKDVVPMAKMVTSFAKLLPRHVHVDSR